jgi:asparagine synthase (glutamine-hydrolysing)
MYYVAKLARKYITVTLTGDGGDELFAGYDRYIAGQILHLYCAVPLPLREKLIPRFLAFFKERTTRKSWRQTLRWVNSMSMVPENEAYARGISFFAFENEQKDQLYTDEFKHCIGAVNSMEGIMSRYWSDHASDTLGRMSYSDLTVRLPEYSHIKVDRISMMHGLEARSPFMDHKLIEFSATIPSRLKLKRKKRKYLLRKIAASYLPPEILNLPKQGFGSPINKWLRGELKRLSHTLLKNALLVKDGYFKQSYIENILAEHESRKINNGNKIWGLVNLETWYRIYFSDTTIENSRENVRDIFHSLSQQS